MDFVAEISNLVSNLQQYKNQTVNKIMQSLSITTNAKSKNYIIASNLCYLYKGKSYFTSLCEHENIHLKTIQLKVNGRPQEAMSFAPIDFNKIVNECWEKSSFKKFLDGYFIFFVFKKIEEENIISSIFLWKMSNDDLSKVKIVWESTKKYLMDGNVIKEIKNNKIITNFISEADDMICHIRPHGKNGLDLVKLPVVDQNTGFSVLSKQSFWFNHNYLIKIINEMEN